MPGFPVWPPEARLTVPEMSGLLAPLPYTTAALMGIRAQESLIRTRAVTRRAVDNYITYHSGSSTNRGNLFKAYPVYDWRTEDVWAAARLKGWDYNRSYDLLEMAGISPAAQRCSPAFGEEPLQKIHTYAQAFPDVWAKMAERVPGIGAAQRYALTELYGYGGRPEKPDGVTWPEFISHYVAKFGPKERPMVANRIKKEIASHYRRTSDPLVYKAPHPGTGICWWFLLTLAMRGDFKNRKQAGGRLLKPPPQLWATYLAEVAEIAAAGTAAEYAHPRPWPADPIALLPDNVDLIS
jgi:predicted phosphoadenosine phosphosulfate sulfurtransferase